MEKTKIIVRYLPQFHRIPENDAWWGEGFTEWTAVKKGEPLFNGHRQPRIPLNDNYYDLMDRETMIWQAKIGQQFGVDCFSFYHYWFKDGRKILEKPAENLLKWNDIEMPFCFTWANETWARTWSKLAQKNAWADSFEGGQTRENTNDNGILLEQKYGTEIDWKQHIEYLLPFFKDERYLKKDGMPVFIIYKPDSIYCLDDMLECWNKILKQNGIKGLYLIGETQSIVGPFAPALDARVLRLPDCIMSEIKEKRLKNGLRVLDYDLYWETLLKMDWQIWHENKKSYLCVAMDYDTTPRRGAAGTAFSGVTVEKFKNYFRRLVEKSNILESEYIFFNAWNEWGEGMYLEPDEDNQYGFLEAIQKTMASVRREYKTNVHDELGCKEFLRLLERKYYKERIGFLVLEAWMKIRDEHKQIEKYLLKFGYNEIAIYGLGFMGRHLVEDLRGTSIRIAYIIDRDISAHVEEYETLQLKSELPHVDAIIVTPIGQYKAIKAEIKKYVNYHVLSLAHIIFEL